MTAPHRPLDAYALDDRYARTRGRVFLTGTQALVRIALDQARRDRAAGLRTAGLISGYRGSPLGGVDLELWRQAKRLTEAKIEFLPAVNEDLAATAILGSQQVETNPAATVQGVFGLWYGKGPGVDRAGDALKHGNAYGSSPHGGVLVVAGDDHGCVSSSMPHQSDVAFMAWFMPTLNPSSVAEFLDFGAWGFAASRYSGMWVGFKAVSEVVESAQSFDLPPEPAFARPALDLPPGGLHYRWPDLPGPQIETRMEAKKRALLAFAAANPLDRRIYGLPDARFGFVTTGKAHPDLMEALRLLGLDEGLCRARGIDILKVGMVWPLEPKAALSFVEGKAEILVIEEKRGIIESQLKEYFYDWPGAKPRVMVGKADESGAPLVPWIGELSPRLLVPLIARRLDRLFPDLNLGARAREVLGAGPQVLNIPGATRTPYFCSGCPHNTSTVVPEGSQALAGIGCHFMASWMDRDTSSLIQMGGEGVNWAASSRFTGKGHVFQNLGEGTWYHSGSMAIRQAIAAGANITYKILYNDAVAMTGGQPVDGPISVQAIAAICRAEGVARIALVSDDIAKFRTSDFPNGTTFHDRDALDGVQRGLREVAGVSVLIYEQTCATETRRRRKRGLAPQPAERVIIHDAVCEGCGDCSVQSNCLSVEPQDTDLGTKRRINPSSCNSDLSCLKGFCPSFVTVAGAGPARAKPAPDPGLDSALAALPEPDLKRLTGPWDVLITGVGGTGVVTVGQVLAMAAHLEGRGASILDFTGFAQKFGPVLGFLRLAPRPQDLNQVRIDRGAADALIGGDLVVSTAPKASAALRPGTRAVVTTTAMPTGDIVRRRDASLDLPLRLAALRGAVGGEVGALDAGALAQAQMGDQVFANMVLTGFAWQSGLIPLGLAAIDRALALNGTDLEANRRAFALGRLARVAPERLLPPAPAPQTLAQMIDRRAEMLAAYQDARLAEGYRAALGPVLALGDAALSQAAALGLFRLMYVKDEYEVARLYADPAFAARIRAEFGADARVTHHLAPPLLPGRDGRGRPRKRRFPGWAVAPAFRLLARMKGLRGGRFDPFARLADRRAERADLDWYLGLLARAVREGAADRARWRAILAQGDQIRGYGVVRRAGAERARAEVARLLG